MAKSFAEWKPLEHGPLRQLQDNLYCVEGALPGGMPLRRCMTVARMASGALVVHNAVALGDEAMAELDALGEVAFILVPSGMHRLDAPNFRKRYPEATLLCPPAARKKVEAVVQVDGSYEDFPDDAAVALELLDGLAGAEGVMKVSSGSALTLVFNDVLFNVSRASGGLIMSILGSTGGPKVTRVMRLLAVKDKKALRGHLERLADLETLTRLVPGHGDIIDVDAPATLRAVAQTL